MKRALTVLVAVLGLTLVPPGAAESSYVDPAGDAGAAPDITAVTVSNTDDGTITFRVSVSLVPDSGLVTFIEHDLSPATNPFTVVALLASDGTLVSALMDPDENEVPGLPTSASSSGGVVQFQLPKSALGIDDLFGFWLASLDLGTGNVDRAPDGNFAWAYALTKPAPPEPPAVVKPVIGKPAAAPAAPVAGKRFTVVFPVRRSDDGQPFGAAVVTCKTTVAGKPVSHRHTFRSGTLRATLVVPKTAKGKQLKVAVKIAAQNQAATKVVTYKIR